MNGQQKIHSRIVQAADGHLYFTSFDEEGEKADGSRQPKWGGHLWRLCMPQRQWEHLLAAPEALITPGTSGPAAVKAIGPFNPKGKSHAACLFTDGGNWLAGALRVSGQNYEWIHRDLATGAVTTCPLTIPGTPRTSSLLLYGSIARDASGACYVVGMAGKAPIVLRVRDTGRPGDG